MKGHLIALFVVSTMPVFAASPPSAKPAWQWTVDERLAARFDEAARARRVDEYLAQRAVTGNRAPATAIANRPTDVIHGSKHPELLLPSEIFTSFTRAAYEEDDETAANVRAGAAPQLPSLGLPADFLSSWRSIAGVFITQQQEELRLKRAVYSGKSTNSARDKARLRQLGALECRSRADAIRRLRTAFGARFNQFLYAVAAPNVFIVNKQATPEQLRAEEEGCP